MYTGILHVFHRTGPFLVVLLFLFAACQPGEEEAQPAEEEPEVTAEMVQLGEEVYIGAGLCQTCHGADGSGTELGPDLTDDRWINIDEPVTREKVEDVVREGVMEPVEYAAPMPPMGGAELSEEEIEAVSAFVMTLHE